MAQHNGHILKVLWAKCADQYQVLSALNVVLTGVQASECGGCNADIELIWKWIGVAARMGSPNLRILTGRSTHEGFSRKQVFEWMARNIRAWAIKELAARLWEYRSRTVRLLPVMGLCFLLATPASAQYIHEGELILRMGDVSANKFPFILAKDYEMYKKNGLNVVPKFSPGSVATINNSNSNYGKSASR